jgi:metal-responsive CopG/Arc/MetJ family transcriptional regulator
MKTQIVLPDLLMEDLRNFVPYRKRSQFIAKAVEKRLQSIKFQKILQDVAGG